MLNFNVKLKTLFICTFAGYIGGCSTIETKPDESSFAYVNVEQKKADFYDALNNADMKTMVNLLNTFPIDEHREVYLDFYIFNRDTSSVLQLVEEGDNFSQRESLKAYRYLRINGFGLGKTSREHETAAVCKIVESVKAIDKFNFEVDRDYETCTYNY